MGQGAVRKRGGRQRSGAEGPWDAPGIFRDTDVTACSLPILGDTDMDVEKLGHSLGKAPLWETGICSGAEERGSRPVGTRREPRGTGSGCFPVPGVTSTASNGQVCVDTSGALVGKS